VRIYFDTEFIEDGKTIDLISIGLIREDGLTYYAESSEADLSRANDWVKSNVLVHLKGNSIPRAQIAKEILEFVGESPEFWAYYADYDWVALCQLYGRMIDLPKGWPMFCRDIKQEAVRLGRDHALPEQSSTEHDALNDAVWNMLAHDHLRGEGNELNILDQLERDGWKVTVSAYSSGLRAKSFTRFFDQRIPGEKRPDIVTLIIEGHYRNRNADSEPVGYWLSLSGDITAFDPTLLWFPTIEEAYTAATAIIAWRGV
jgi:hypothetical protein